MGSFHQHIDLALLRVFISLVSEWSYLNLAFKGSTVKQVYCCSNWNWEIKCVIRFYFSFWWISRVKQGNLLGQYMYYRTHFAPFFFDRKTVEFAEPSGKNSSTKLYFFLFRFFLASCCVNLVKKTDKPKKIFLCNSRSRVVAGWNFCFFFILE